MHPFDTDVDDVDDTYEEDVADHEADDGSGEPRRRRRRRRGRRRERRQSARVRRSRWRMVLLGGTTVLAVYYGLVVFGMRRGDSDVVPVANDLTLTADRVDVEVEATEVDPGGGAFDLRLRPLPRGDFEGDAAGQLAVPLQLVLSAPGQPPISFDFPADQILDPVAATVDATAGAQGFPFDRPQAAFRLQATSEDEPVPVGVEVVNGTEGWNLAGRVGERGDAVAVDVDADRELLAISFSMFYIAGTVVVALITVALIGGAIARGQVGFDQVIWLGAMLVAIPAVRNEMPGVPPIGTLVDLFVFLPSVVIVAMALLAAIVVLAINEAAASKVTADGG